MIKKFVVLIVIFLLSSKSAYAQTGPYNFNITYNSSCIDNPFADQIIATLSWTNPAIIPTNWALLWRQAGGTGYAVKFVSGSTTQTDIPTGFSTSFFNGPNIIPTTLTSYNYVDLLFNGTGNPTGDEVGSSYNFTYNPLSCPIPATYNLPDPQITWKYCVIDSATRTYSGDGGPGNEFNISWTNPAGNSVSRVIISHINPDSGRVIDSQRTVSPDITSVNGPQGFNPNFTFISTLPYTIQLFGQGQYSREVYLGGPSPCPKPVIPTICRNPAALYPIHNDTFYSDSELQINREKANNPLEYIYLGKNGTWNGTTKSYPDAYWSSKQVTGQLSVPAPLNFSRPLNTGTDYYAYVCNKPVDLAGNPTNWQSNCSSAFGPFCMANDQTSACNTNYVPPPCVIPPPVYCGLGETKSTGLVSAPGQTGDFTTTGACIINKDATFIPDRIDSYAGLKLNYYTQAKSSTSNKVIKHPPIDGNQDQGAIQLTANNDHIYQISGNLTISNNIPGNQTGVIFIDGNLNISNNITTSAGAGLVFVTGGDVNIASTVTKIDAVIISSGTIYTAGAGCIASEVPSSTLSVNGSLVSLTEAKPVQFCRKLVDNTAAAEKIIHDPKYQIILRNLFARKEQFWSEVP